MTVSLFVCVTYAASKSIETIIREVNSSFPKLFNASVHQVIKWKQHYFWISTFVVEIDRFFGIFLFVFLVRVFASTFLISYSAATYWRSSDAKLSTSFTLLIKYGIITLLVIYTCEKMKKQASVFHNFL